ncbi:target of Nesh-SH3 isoform X8 [Oncorhynchus tshawytscha]|uniref:target of Nesh-SH3 isoform X8 n=1 Tax=Oncorhynchus tshawytscha TaxID=74940 RepID=UPI001C3C93E8|nr:target of Nesh-SH3 isoform X8 [Oncorhynchus tshawytscha]
MQLSHTFLLFLIFIVGMALASSSTARRSRVRRQNMKVRINATGDTIVMKFVRPNADTKLEGYILGYGSSMFSKQFIQLPENGLPYETEIDAEPKYLIAVQPVPVNNVKKQCTGKVNLEKPLHLVIGSVTPTSVLLSWGTFLKMPYEGDIMNDCLEDGHYTVRYRERNRKWTQQTCPSSDMVIDNLKPNTAYEFGVRPNNEERSGVWSKPVIHNTNMEKTMQKPFRPRTPLTPLKTDNMPLSFFPPRHAVHNRSQGRTLFRTPMAPRTTFGRADQIKSASSLSVDITRATPTIPCASPTIPRASPTVPRASPTIPRASSTVPLASSTIPRASPTIPVPPPPSPVPPPPSPVPPQPSPRSSSTIPRASPTLPLPSPTLPHASPSSCPPPPFPWPLPRPLRITPIVTPDPNRPDPKKPDPSLSLRPSPNRPDPNRPDPNKPDPSLSLRPSPNRSDSNRSDPKRPDPNPRLRPSLRPSPKRPDPNRSSLRPSLRPNLRPSPNRSDPNRLDPNRSDPNRPDPSLRLRPSPNRSSLRPSLRPNLRPSPNRPDPNLRPSPNRPDPNRPDPSQSLRPSPNSLLRSPRTYRPPRLPANIRWDNLCQDPPSPLRGQIVTPGVPAS